VLDRTRQTHRRISPTFAQELFGFEGLTRDASSFTVREVIQTLCERRGPGVSAAQIEREANELLESDLVVRLSAAKSDFLLSRRRCSSAMARSSPRLTTPPVTPPKRCSVSKSGSSDGPSAVSRTALRSQTRRSSRRC
jgi:hypothetical protein